MFLKYADEAIAVRGLNEMDHLVSNHVFEQVLRLLYQFGVEADVLRPVVAASPLSLHALQKIAVQSDLKLPFPFLNKWRYLLVEQCFVPLVDNLSPLRLIAPR